MVVFKVHVASLFGNFVDLIELIHVELADKGCQSPVPEEAREDSVFEFLCIFDQYFGAFLGPADVVIKLFFLQ